MMKNINLLILAIAIFLTGCTSEKKSITDIDTTMILDKAFNNPQIDESLSILFTNQPLRIVKNPLLKNDYKFFKNGMPVVYTDIDSSNSKLSNWRKPKFYANIVDFKVLSKEKATVTIIFKSSGHWILMDLTKKDEEWIIAKFEDREI
ncbi:hypothetical protein VB776_23865 [Arcicella sp. DC2W]|uniref:DUF4348 domain-containing protein n=1 Tax=Arcicella gelida TaxID=2984195 RepID=A0ABU5SBY8_9BACT|nr:hypothetical protein [Arcicella sp. DC2W]MEA5405997.1 hypothetical protein [Arcicella sp. DC2W]